MAKFRFADKRAQAILDALMSSKDAAEFSERLDRAFEVLQKGEPPEQINKECFKRGKSEFRSC